MQRKSFLASSAALLGLAIGAAAASLRPMDPLISRQRNLPGFPGLREGRPGRAQRRAAYWAAQMFRSGRGYPGAKLARKAEKGMIGVPRPR